MANRQPLHGTGEKPDVNRHRVKEDAMPAQPAPLSSIDVGDIRVTYLPDGDARLSPTIVFPPSNDALWAAHAEYLDEDSKLLLTFGGFLIETRDRKVIVDLALGDMEVPFPPVEGFLRGGRFLESLEKTGVAPAEVDAVLYTHLHLDHVGWTAQGGSLTFPNARHLAGAGEWDFWRSVTDDEWLVAMGPDREAVQTPLENRIDSVADGESIAPGVTAVATPGHTPGHCSVVISSGTERAIILGDTVVCPLQFDERDLNFLFDVDQALAGRTRERIFAELEGTPETVVACAHYAESVFGRLVPGHGKSWVSLS